MDQQEQCPAVYLHGCPVRCKEPLGHQPESGRDVIWHVGGGIDPADGEPFGAAWRYLPALTA